MNYSRDEVRAITDKVLNMARADAVEVEFSGGERAACRYANSNITANLDENDHEVQITVYYGQKSATTFTHQFDDASLKTAIEQAQELARRKPDNPEVMPPVPPPRDYIAVDAALPSVVNFVPAEQARMVKRSLDICDKKGVLGAGYVPRLHWTDAIANSAGLFAYHRFADASFILTCRTKDGTGSGWAGITGVRDIAQTIRRRSPRSRPTRHCDRASRGRSSRELHGDPGAPTCGTFSVHLMSTFGRARPRRGGAS